MGHPLTTAYTTLGPEGLQHSLDEPSVRMVFTNAALLPTLLKVVDDCPSLVWVIYDGEDTVDQVSRSSEQSMDKARRIDDTEERRWRKDEG